MKPPRTIAVDFDGVIHAYTSGWTGHVPADEPVPGAREGIAKIRARGLRVVVFTCRALTVEGRAGIAAWLVEHGIEVDEITAIKPHASVYLDDRAVRFEGLWSLAVEAALDVPPPWNAAEQLHSGGRNPTCGECGGEVALDPRPDGHYRECGHPIPEREKVAGPELHIGQLRVRAQEILGLALARVSEGQAVARTGFDRLDVRSLCYGMDALVEGLKAKGEFAAEAKHQALRVALAALVGAYREDELREELGYAA